MPVCLSSVVGAWLAGRVAGSERVLFGSAVLIMFGRVSLALLPGVAGVAVVFGPVLAVSVPAVRKLMPGVR